MSDELIIMPYICEALAVASNIYKDIDNIYKKNKVVYYRIARESEFYDCNVCSGLSLISEEYFKKILGIMQAKIKYRDAELQDKIYGLIRKAYKRTWLYFKNCTKPDMNDYMTYLMKELKNYDTDTFNGHAAIAIYLSIDMEASNRNQFLELINMRREHEIEGEKRFNVSKLTNEDRDEIKCYIESFTNKANVREVLEGAENYSLSILYDTEDLSLQSLLSSVEFCNDNIDEIIYSYILGVKYYNLKEEFKNYYISALNVKMLLKAYNSVKKMYFKNNKETMFIELDSLKQENIKLRSEVNGLKESIIFKNKEEDTEKESLLKEVLSLRKKISDLEKELEQKESHSVEVFSLREYVFQNSNYSDPVVSGIQKFDFGKIEELKGVIVGGHPEWQRKLKNVLSDWECLGMEISAFDEALIRNRDIVLINTGYISHKLYYKVMAAVEKNKNKCIFTDLSNLDRIGELIYNKIFIREE